MPIYEYQCKNCDTVFEIIVSMTSQTAVHCNKCGSNKVNKLISATGSKPSKGVNLTAPSQCQPRGGFS